MVVENKVSLSHIDCTFGLWCVSPPCHDELYDRSRYRTSAMWVFRENFIFSPLSTYSLTPKANKNTLKPSSLDYNLHVM